MTEMHRAFQIADGLPLCTRYERAVIAGANGAKNRIATPLTFCYA